MIQSGPFSDITSAAHRHSSFPTHSTFPLHSRCCQSTACWDQPRDDHTNDPERMRTFIVVVVALLELVPTWGYLSLNTRQSQRRHGRVVWSSTNDKDVVGDEGLADLLTSRLPTSVDDQVRQAVDSLRRATSDGLHRHSLRLLLPVIGATELDDWPGGARQMMQAGTCLSNDSRNYFIDDKSYPFAIFFS